MEQSNQPKTYEELTTLQRRFVDFYIQHWKAAKAARLAGYSPDIAKQIGYENLTKPYLRAIINERAQLFVASEGEVATRLTKFARGSLKSFLEGSEIVVDKSNKDIDLVKKIKVVKTTTRVKDVVTERVSTELEIEDRQAALDKLAKMMGMYKTDNRQEQTNPYAELTPEQLLEELHKLGYKKAEDGTPTQNTHTE